MLGLLNRLIQRPELITCPVPEAKPPSEVDKMRRELDELLHRPPVDETRARRLAFRLAALQLDAIGPEEYGTLDFGGCSRDGTHGRTGAGTAP